MAIIYFCMMCAEPGERIWRTRVIRDPHVITRRVVCVASGPTTRRKQFVVCSLDLQGPGRLCRSSPALVDPSAAMYWSTMGCSTEVAGDGVPSGAVSPSVSSGVSSYSCFHS